MKGKLILILTVITQFLFSCSKEKDYRDKYIGNWNFEVRRIEFSGDSILFNDTINYMGNITYGSSDNDIAIQYTEEDVVTLTVDEEGNLDNFPSDLSYGSLEVDSIFIRLYWGGQGAGITHLVAGER